MSTTPPSFPPAPAAPQKKTSPWVWVLAGIGGFLVLMLVLVIGAGWFVANKIKQSGVDPDLMKSNPGLAVVKMAAALNKDVEIVSVDEGKDIVNVRDRKSGKTYTVNFEDAKKGKFSFRENGGKDASVEITQGEGRSGKGTVRIESADGKFRIGGGEAKVPTWIPDYPGSAPQAAFSAQTDDGSSGSYAFKTADSADKVTKFYEDGFHASGLKTTSTSNYDGSKTAHVVRGESDGKSAVVVLGSDSGNTAVSVTFKSNK